MLFLWVEYLKYTVTVPINFIDIENKLEQHVLKEVGPLTAILALSVIKFMKYGIVQFLLCE